MIIDKVGKDQMLALVTDNAANMRAARQLLIEMEGYGHIIEVRCAAWRGAWWAGLVWFPFVMAHAHRGVVARVLLRVEPSMRMDATQALPATAMHAGA